jgi:hypothetical protein
VPCLDLAMTPLLLSRQVNNEVRHNGSCAFHLVTKKKGDPIQYKAPFPQRLHADFSSSPHPHPYPYPFIAIITLVPIQWLAQLFSHTRLPHPLRPPTTSDLGKSQPAPISDPLAFFSFLPHLFSPRHSRSPTQCIERRLIRLWKRMTGNVRRNERASILPDGFVLMNAAAARRRSRLYMASAKS